MRSLKRDVGGRAWCGPTAIGAITGEPLSKVREVLREAKGGQTIKYRGKWGQTCERLRPVKGTTTGQVIRALAKLGWIASRISVPNEPTLAAFLRKRTPSLMNVHLLIEVTNHWVVVKGRKFVDTFTKGEPVFIGKAPGRRKRVHGVWIVTKI
jgi:hypothetical protein